ncbi:MAG: hypothetical protein JSR69_05795 [Proteobacteria bacterium]|nr:hypothetical protein [Pseudomonadota bacterium]
MQEDNLGPELFGSPRVGLLSLTPERRIVLSNFQNNRFCAEAPTEIGIDMNSALTLTGIVNTLQKSSTEMGAALTAFSKNSALNKRSQGIQLYLSASYTFCQIYLNGAISDQDYVNAQLKVLQSVIPIIKSEIPYIHGQNLGAAESREHESSGAVDKADELLKKP